MRTRTHLQSNPVSPISIRPWRKPSYWLKLIAFALVTLYISLTVAMAVMGTLQSIRSAQRPVCCETPTDWGFTYEEASLVAPDGIKLAGWYIPPQTPPPGKPSAAVILLHGYSGHRLGTKPYAEMLARHGYAVLMYDQRASGESEGDLLSWGWRDVADVQGAIAFLQARPELANGKIGILGCSTGAEIAIASAAQQPAIQAVVADAPYYTVAQDLPPVNSLLEWLTLPMYHLLIQFMEWKSGASAPQPLEAAVTQISPRPLLLISAGLDFEKRLAENYYQLAGEPKQHWNIPEASHCGGPKARPQEYESRIVEFFDAALLDR